jgi:hypothetical protein
MKLVIDGLPASTSLESLRMRVAAAHLASVSMSGRRCGPKVRKSMSQLRQDCSRSWVSSANPSIIESDKCSETVIYANLNLSLSQASAEHEDFV